MEKCNRSEGLKLWEVLYKFSLREVLEDCECSGNLMMSLNKQSCVIVVVFNALLPMG